ncbi:MAG TPA: hypothetical protein VIG53_01750 [Actinomycetota bacterium]
MRPRDGWAIVVGVTFVLAACSSGPSVADLPTPTTPSSDPGSAAQDVWAFEHFTDLEPGTYFIDPDLDPDTSLRVEFEIPAEGWQAWTGAAKFSEVGHVGVSVTDVSNLVSHGCRDHSWADPPVGPSVDDLATALADLAPFRVTSPVKDVTIYGYDGEYLELTVPKLPVDGAGRFTGCEDKSLMSWVAPFDTPPDDAFYGYTGPGYTEEFWILDVDGSRLMVAAERSPDPPSQDLAELRDILDSILIEP